MARIRTIKPEFWSDKTMAKMPIFTRFFYIGLWNFADDAGRGRASAKELNGCIFAADENIENGQVEAALQELASHGRIILYMDGEDRLFQICKWAEHQVINRPSKSKFPRPEGFTEPSEPPNEESLNTHGSLTEASHSPQCWEVEDGRRKTEDGRGIRKTEDGRRKTEGEAGETAAPPTEAPQLSVPSVPSFGTGASVPSVPSPEPVRSQPPRQNSDWHLSDADIRDLLKSKWTRQEIEWGVQVGIESKAKPRSARSILHASILPEVREGKRPMGATANAPPTTRPEPEKPTPIDPVKLAQMEEVAAERKRIREAALALNGPQGGQNGSAAH